MSLEKFDQVEEIDNEEEEYPQSIKNVRQSKIDIRKSKINMRQSKLSMGGPSMINMRLSKNNIPRSMIQMKQSSIVDLGLYQANPEDVWTPKDHAESVKYINQFINATQLQDENQPIYEEIKEFCKNRKNRQLLILNDFHLYLRDAYKAKFAKQQIILEIIYQISLEKDFCDELALLGGLIDEAFVFLQTHLKSYNKADVDDYYNKAQENTLQTYDVEIIDSATLLKLDLWIRIAANFSKNDQVLEYIASNKEDVIKYLLIFLQNIDNVIKKNPNLSSINSVIIASSIKTGVLDILFLLTQLDEMRNRVIYNQSYFSAIYKNLLKKTSNQTTFSSICKLISQLAASQKFPIHILNVNIIEDFLFTYMMRVVYNVGLTDYEPEDIAQSNWANIQQERELRKNYLVELGLARTFFYLTVNQHQRKLLMKSILDYEDHILFRFMFKCFENKQLDALIYMVLGLTQLVQKEQLKLKKDYHRQIVMYIYQECDQIFIEKDSLDEKQRMLITILMTRFIKLIHFKREEIEQVLELMNAKLNNHLKVPPTLPAPQLDEQTITKEIRTKKPKKYEERDKGYTNNIMGYNIQGIIINERPYGDSVNYSRLISEINEDDFEDSLLEDDIFHLRVNGNTAIQQDLLKQNKEKQGQIVKQVEQEKQQMFNFEKRLYPKNKDNQDSPNTNRKKINNYDNSFLYEQKKQIKSMKGQDQYDKYNQGLSFGITPLNSKMNNEPASFNVSSIKNQGSNQLQANNQSEDFIRDDLAVLNANNRNESVNINQNQNQILTNQQQREQRSEKVIKDKPKNEQEEQILYLNSKKQCFQFHIHYKRRCEYCQNIYHSFLDQPNIYIEQWIFNQQTGVFDEIFWIDFFYENFIQIINALFYMTMALKGELPQSVLKQLCIVIANEFGQHSDRRYKSAVILLISHIIQINPSFVNRLIQINFLCVQDFLLTQFLNCFGYKTFNLLKLIKRGTGSVNKNPIFEQVQRRGSKLSSLDEEDLDEEKDNVYQNYVIQSTLLIEFDGIQFNNNEVTLTTQQSAEYMETNKDKEFEEPDHLSKFLNHILFIRQSPLLFLLKLLIILNFGQVLI